MVTDRSRSAGNNLSSTPRNTAQPASQRSQSCPALRPASSNSASRSRLPASPSSCMKWLQRDCMLPLRCCTSSATLFSPGPRTACQASGASCRMAPSASIFTPAIRTRTSFRYSSPSRSASIPDSLEHLSIALPWNSTPPTSFPSAPTLNPLAPLGRKHTTFYDICFSRSPPPVPATSRRPGCRNGSPAQAPRRRPPGSASPRQRPPPAAAACCPAGAGW